MDRALKTVEAMPDDGSSAKLLGLENSAAEEEYRPSGSERLATEQHATLAKLDVETREPIIVPEMKEGRVS
jgi:hypothetical protein